MPGNQRLHTIASSFSARATRSLRSVQKQLLRDVEAQAIEHAQCEAARQALLEREDAAIKQRIPFARKGLERILEFGKSNDVENIRASYVKLNPSHGEFGIDFFSASRPSGDDWETGPDDKKYGATRDVMFSLEYGHLRIIIGAFGVGSSDTYDVLFKPESDERAVSMGGNWTFHSRDPERPATIDEFLYRIACPYTQSMSLVKCWAQRRYEWQPQNVAFQVLVSCGRKSSFDWYLEKCLVGLEKKLQKVTV